MKKETLYENLADHFDRFIVGRRARDTLIRILQILFPRDEAKTALRMPVMHQMTLSEWQAAIPEDHARLPEILNAMAARGTVQTYRQPGKKSATPCCLRPRAGSTHPTGPAGRPTTPVSWRRSGCNTAKKLSARSWRGAICPLSALCRLVVH